MTSLLTNMNNNVRKFITALAFRIYTREDPIERDDVATIPLVHCLRTLKILWMEYKFGIGVNKPAKLFIARERCKVKFSYSLSKPFWILVEKMIRYGYSRARCTTRIE